MLDGSNQPIKLLDTRYGLMAAPGGEDLISRSLELYGEWAEAEISAFRRFLNPGDTALDIGACFGTHTLAMADAVGPGGRVIAIDASPGNFAYLKRNAGESPYAASIQLINAAASSAAGEHFKIIGTSGNLGATRAERAQAGEVDSIAIDNLGLTRLAFMKLDIEGMEAEALKGAARTISTIRPTIFFEVNTIQGALAVVDVLREAGYEFFGVALAAYNPENFCRNPHNIFGHSSECGIFATPAELSADALTKISDLKPLRIEDADDVSTLLLRKPQYLEARNLPMVAAEQLETLRSEVHHLNDQYAAKERIIGEQEAQIGRLNHDLDSLRRNLSELNEVLGSEIRRLNDLHAAKAKIAGEQEREIGRLTDNLLEAERQFDQLRRHSLQTEDQLIAAQDELIRLDQASRQSFPLGTLRRPHRPDATSGPIECAAVSSSTDDRINVEAAVRRGLTLDVEGWYFNSTRETVSGELIVFWQERCQISTIDIGLERRDVEAVFGPPGLRSGFRISCRLEIDFSKCYLAYLAFSSNHNRHRSIYRLAIPQTHAPIHKVLWHARNYVNPVGWASIWGAWKRKQLSHVYFELQDSLLNPEPVASSALESLQQPTRLEDALAYLRSPPNPVEPLTTPVDVVIPVFNGFDFLEALLNSLKRNTPDSVRIVIVDDCSTDPRVYPSLEAFAGTRKNVTLVRLTQNHGFVGAVNHGASLSQNDFVILNTDTEVPPQWLERLMAPLLKDPRVATVTPFSNSATICSFPNFCEDNQLIEGLSVEEIDRWLLLVDADKVERDMPTGVGFCLAIRRSIWTQIGPFDRDVFKQGYGEENDWCQRAISAGYKNVICPNLFVYHKHGGTFAGSHREVLQKRGYEALLKLHPTYPSQIEDYIRRDPLGPLRDIVLLVLLANEADKPLHFTISHSWGGGAGHYLDGLLLGLRERGHPTLSLMIVPPHDVGHSSYDYKLDFRYRDISKTFCLSNLDCLTSLLALANPSEIFVNETVTDQKPLELVDFVLNLKKLLGCRLVFPVHDYYALCPSYTLLDSTGRFCGLPNEDHCKACLLRNAHAHNPGNHTIEEWRLKWSMLLSSADEVICFSDSSRRLLTATYPNIESRVVLKPHRLNVNFDRTPRLRPHNELRIGVVGSIGYHKGSEVLQGLARVMLIQNPTAKIVVIGHMDTTGGLTNIETTGQYRQEDLPDLLERERVGFVFFPSIWPETFSYVSHELIALSVPLVAFDIGAPGDTIRSYDKGWILDLRLSEAPKELYCEIMKIHEELVSEGICGSSLELTRQPALDLDARSRMTLRATH